MVQDGDCKAVFKVIRFHLTHPYSNYPINRAGALDRQIMECSRGQDGSGCACFLAFHITSPGSGHFLQGVWGRSAAAWVRGMVRKAHRRKKAVFICLETCNVPFQEFVQLGCGGKKNAGRFPGFLKYLAGVKDDAG